MEGDCIVIQRKTWYNFNELSTLDTKIKTLDSRAIKNLLIYKNDTIQNNSLQYVRD